MTEPTFVNQRPPVECELYIVKSPVYMDVKNREKTGRGNQPDHSAYSEWFGPLPHDTPRIPGRRNREGSTSAQREDEWSAEEGGPVEIQITSDRTG